MEYRRDWGGEDGAKKALEAEMNSYNRPEKKSSKKSQSCHYCGCEARDFDFFGSPVCDDCR